MSYDISLDTHLKIAGENAGQAYDKIQERTYLHMCGYKSKVTVANSIYSISILHASLMIGVQKGPKGGLYTGFG